MKLPRARVVLAALPLAGLLLAGCSGGSNNPSTGASAGADLTAQPTPATASPAGTVVRIRIGTDDVDPAGSLVKVTRNQPVTLLITAVRAGELHVHSSPEQHIEFPVGSSAVSLTFAQPGVIDVEDHALDKLIIQLEVH